MIDQDMDAHLLYCSQHSLSRTERRSKRRGGLVIPPPCGSPSPSLSVHVSSGRSIESVQMTVCPLLIPQLRSPSHTGYGILHYTHSPSFQEPFPHEPQGLGCWDKLRLSLRPCAYFAFRISLKPQATVPTAEKLRSRKGYDRLSSAEPFRKFTRRGRISLPHVKPFTDPAALTAEERRRYHALSAQLASSRALFSCTERKSTCLLNIIRIDLGSFRSTDGRH